VRSEVPDFAVYLSLAYQAANIDIFMFAVVSSG
jgi:hypothetical protein